MQFASVILRISCNYCAAFHEQWYPAAKGVPVPEMSPFPQGWLVWPTGMVVCPDHTIELRIDGQDIDPFECKKGVAREVHS